MNDMVDIPAPLKRDEKISITPLTDMPELLAKLTDSEVEAQEDEDKTSQLPEPVGYRILCAVPTVEEKTAGGIIKADSTRHMEQALSTVVFVMKIGPEAYFDKARFPNGPWCKEGDFILIRPNTGTRLFVHGREFRLINDDCVEAVVDDPRGISRA